MARVLTPGGRLIVVDGGQILREDTWSRFLNWAFRITVSPDAGEEARKSFNHPCFAIERREVLGEWSSVGVSVAVRQ
jgi:hypothetical protein